jgi:hypothetical protein
LGPDGVSQINNVSPQELEEACDDFINPISGNNMGGKGRKKGKGTRKRGGMFSVVQGAKKGVRDGAKVGLNIVIGGLNVSWAVIKTLPELIQIAIILVAFYYGIVWGLDSIVQMKELATDTRSSLFDAINRGEELRSEGVVYPRTSADSTALALMPPENSNALISVSHNDFLELYKMDEETIWSALPAILKNNGLILIQFASHYTGTNVFAFLTLLGKMQENPSSFAKLPIDAATESINKCFGNSLTLEERYDFSSGALRRLSKNTMYYHPLELYVTNLQQIKSSTPPTEDISNTYEQEVEDETALVTIDGTIKEPTEAVEEKISEGWMSSLGNMVSNVKTSVFGKAEKAVGEETMKTARVIAKVAPQAPVYIDCILQSLPIQLEMQQKMLELWWLSNKQQGVLLQTKYNMSSRSAYYSTAFLSLGTLWLLGYVRSKLAAREKASTRQAIEGNTADIADIRRMLEEQRQLQGQQLRIQNPGQVESSTAIVPVGRGGVDAGTQIASFADVGTSPMSPRVMTRSRSRSFSNNNSNSNSSSSDLGGINFITNGEPAPMGPFEQEAMEAIARDEKSKRDRTPLGKKKAYKPPEGGGGRTRRRTIQTKKRRRPARKQTKKRRRNTKRRRM